ncbi:MAG: hypothetical protein DI536_21770 [Archangium gephyra]|uniref:ADP-ribosylation/crystallin J1 n=1 Tax=Archangium gephyra TaxID=48 RepID=A0A2W5VGX9_9BACT|nr:MAG: hypothetical protein DI536_21770 [Archangium gephyra]
MFTTLFRPVGPIELALIRDSDWTRFPPRLGDQPLFYPVVQETYARRIAAEWNVRESGEGHVVKFAVQTEFLQRYPEQVAGGIAHTEHWIPAEDLEAFNDHLIGKIALIASYR